MRDTIPLDVLRRHPTEWRRRGLTPPTELAQIVAARVGEHEHVSVPAEPSYADFFAA